jgi:hypothetical protein
LIGLGLLASAAPGATSGGEITHGARGSVAAQLQLFPTRPRAGQSATLQLRPYRLVSGRGEPTVIASGHRWRVTATRQGRPQTVSLRFSRDAADPYLWTARVRFRAAGLWIVRIAGGRSDALKVRVRRLGAVGIWARLERPLHTPTIAPGAACPTSALDPRGDLSRFGFVGRAWGDGPVYPVFSPLQAGPGFFYDDPIPPESVFYGSRWFGQKVPWVIDLQAYRGPILIRGRQVNGLNSVRFELAPVPAPELKLGSGVDFRASTTRIRTSGCYAYQVDGTTFSSVLVFEALPAPIQ